MVTSKLYWCVLNDEGDNRIAFMKGLIIDESSLGDSGDFFEQKMLMSVAGM